MVRNLDGCYFRVQRDGKWQSICFSDLTKDEREDVMNGKGPDWLKSLCHHLTDKLTLIGEQFDIVGD